MAAKVQLGLPGTSCFGGSFSPIPSASHPGHSEKLIPITVVCELTSKSRSWIYDAVSKGTFPRPVKIGLRSVAWVHSEIQDWIQQRIQASRPAVEVAEESSAIVKAQSASRISKAANCFTMAGQLGLKEAA